MLTSLRDLMPLRSLSQSEALRLAELQATRLLVLTDTTAGPVPEGVITELPGVEVVYDHSATAPSSGLFRWEHGRYLIVIDGTEIPVGRQRFSLAHEFKHVLDYPFVTTLYPALPGMTSKERQEQVCEFFAACLLMPRTWVKQAWCNERVQEPGRLSRRFGVSAAAMRVRLSTLGLVEQRRRCPAAP
jgi:Zn-dependent peptidase ImmA (M78 family)